MLFALLFTTKYPLYSKITLDFVSSGDIKTYAESLVSAGGSDMFYATSGTTGRPTGTGGGYVRAYRYVESQYTYLKAIFYESNTNRTFVNTKWNSGWIGWEELALNSNIPVSSIGTIVRLVSCYNVSCVFTNGECSIDLSTVIDSSVRSGRTFTSFAMAQFSTASATTAVSISKSTGSTYTIKAIKSDGTAYSGTTGVSILVGLV